MPTDMGEEYMNNALAIARLERHLSAPTDSGCIEWTGSLSAEGYGQIRIQRKLYRTHRLAYLATGGALGNDEVVDHICGNRACCNPRHLRSYSQTKNGQYRTVVNVNNTSGFPGVVYAKHAKLWRAQSMESGRAKHIAYDTTARGAYEKWKQWVLVNRDDVHDSLLNL